MENAAFVMSWPSFGIGLVVGALLCLSIMLKLTSNRKLQEELDKNRKLLAKQHRDIHALLKDSAYYFHAANKAQIELGRVLRKAAKALDPEHPNLSKHFYTNELEAPAKSPAAANDGSASAPKPVPEPHLDNTVNAQLDEDGKSAPLDHVATPKEAQDIEQQNYEAAEALAKEQPEPKAPVAPPEHSDLHANYEHDAPPVPSSPHAPHAEPAPAPHAAQAPHAAPTVHDSDAAPAPHNQAPKA